MFVISSQPKPIKVWLQSEADIEPGCLEQIKHLANLPFAFRHIAIMPDTHQGYGMPIGGVLATQDVIIPPAVGSDIGCGMCYVQTNRTVKELKDIPEFFSSIVNTILKRIPVGDKHREIPWEFNEYVNSFIPKLYRASSDEEVMHSRIFPSAYKQMGTLGGGNHFIELQEDDNGMLCIMLHSGSRNVGKQICDFFTHKAKELNKLWHVSVPIEANLAFFPVDTEEGQRYLEWMHFAQAFALMNRKVMMNEVFQIITEELIKHKLEVMLEVTAVNAHHNYAQVENHFGHNVMVHRKGAIRVQKDELGIIPGSMGSYSYIVKGLGNKESFNSCSHGAGRAMSRTAAKKFTTETVMKDLSDKGITLGKKDLSDVGEESVGAYKDIDTVIANEKDLVSIVSKLKTIAVVKG